MNAVGEGCGCFLILLGITVLLSFPRILITIERVLAP
jgi:hypothetical protein